MPRTTRASTRANAKRVAEIQVESESEAENENENMDVDVEGKSEDDVEREANVEDEDEEVEDEDAEAEGEDEVEQEDDDAPESEDESPPVAPPRLKIKLKLTQTTPSVSVTPTPDASRAASRAPRDVPSSPKLVLINYNESGDSDSSSDIDRKMKRPLTNRQAVLASQIYSTHVALGIYHDLGEESQSKKKKQLTETEIALRREETARKRRNLTEKKLEDEKMETINRLLKKQSRKKLKNTPADDRTPASGVVTGGAGSGTPGQDGSARDGSAEADYVEPVETVIPTMYRWISTTRPQVAEPRFKVGNLGAADGRTEEDDAAMDDVTRVKDETKDTESARADGNMRLTFSIPLSVVPSAAVSTPPPAASKEKPTCDVPGCAQARKYRLVKDWMHGACGMEHLKMLEKQLVV
ncbi:hypothetical protein CONPUDRAFT_76184 [Coniophora puteana RWD-64-598 SS2]|uniref:INO80 complex subunit B-like conserved region domain-containing protein n=1 Tax=Coniophora puteana (strain RWD-64-598) TaxID=741705 RepID=A0A5M3MEA2_CONPW|nr:uncharacterized protein CONPUDRAFT_76184 [Coniophora puteana RWD-64-598 SS2]EIW77473.1 hypothetical protein CONPUDRAFT_76184 [Coniophora puteana RWD-64-598 SS2]